MQSDANTASRQRARGLRTDWVKQMQSQFLAHSCCCCLNNIDIYPDKPQNSNLCQNSMLLQLFSFDCPDKKAIHRPISASLKNNMSKNCF